jgi:hypothetical protein
VSAKTPARRDTTTTATAAIVGGPPPWTREPIHSASNGAPVQMFSVTAAIAATITMERIRP